MVGLMEAKATHMAVGAYTHADTSLNPHGVPSVLGEHAMIMVSYAPDPKCPGVCLRVMVADVSVELQIRPDQATGIAELLLAAARILEYADVPITFNEDPGKAYDYP